MNLKELKAMIAEEYSNYLAEQDEPAVAVSDADVDADGDENAEETLRDIFNMLKDYFEGDDADDADDAGDDADDDADDKETVDEAQMAGPGGGVGQACGPFRPCPANLICKDGTCQGTHGGPGKGVKHGGSGKRKGVKHGGSGKRTRKDDKRPKGTRPTPFNPNPMNEDNLQERFKKLANIIKG